MDFITLYLDASSDPGWPKPWGKSPFKFYSLCGIILTPEQDFKLKEDVTALIDEYFQDPFKQPDELKYGDLINGRNEFHLLSGIKRKELADKVFQIMSNIEPILMGTIIDKEKMKKRYDKNAISPKNYSIRATTDRFHKHLRENDQRGQIMMDNEEWSQDLMMMKMVHKARKVGIKLGGWGYSQKRDSKLERLLNSIVFSPSEMSVGIQMADFIAYATWSAYERGKSDRFKETRRFWRTMGELGPREPSVIPK